MKEHLRNSWWATNAHLPQEDHQAPRTEQGICERYTVIRTDGSSASGGKHEHCKYFVLDLVHDKFAAAALSAYAAACQSTHPQLAADLEAYVVEMSAKSESE